MDKSMQRLYQAAKTLKSIEGQSELARFLNQSPQTVKNWETRGISSLGAIKAAELLNISATWLSTGTGNMQSVGPVKNYLDAETNTLPQKQAQSDYVTFDLLDVEAGAGPGRLVPTNEVLQQVTVLAEWAYRTIGGDLSRINVITARGTSMQGTIENGDVLFVDASITFFDGDGVYIIERDGEIQVKRIQKTHNGFKIISDNRQFDPEELNRESSDELHICGRVVAGWNLKKYW